MVANVERELPQTPSCPLNQLFKSMTVCSNNQSRKFKSSAEMVSESPPSMMIANISPISWAPSPVATPTRKSPPATPQMSDNSLRRSRSQPQQQGMTLYHSPETIKLRLPGTSAASSSPAKSVLPTALFHTPKRVLSMLRGQSSVKTMTTQQQHELYNADEDLFDESIPSEFLDGDSCSCSATTISGAAYTARLTEDVLQRHEHLVKRSPSRQSIPNYAGDNLAKTVIHKKTQYEISREQRHRSKEQKGESNLKSGEDDRQLAKKKNTQYEISKEQRNRTKGTKGEIHSILEEQDLKIETILLQDWQETERQKTLAAKWQQKRIEQQDRMRLEEELQWGELERQRSLRAGQLQKENAWRNQEGSSAKPRIASQLTPKTHHKTAKLIYI